MVKKTNLPYLEIKVSKGRRYIYFRRANQKNIRLPDDMEGEEFSKAYWVARSGKTPSANNKSIERKVRNVAILYKKSRNFKELAIGTKVNYSRHIDDIVAKNGDRDIRNLRHIDIIAARDALQDTWSQASERVAVLSNICKIAKSKGYIDQNPALGVEKFSGGTYEPWPDEFLKKFVIYCEENNCDLERLVYELCIGTGQRIGDVLKMEWPDFKDGYIELVQEKTGTRISVACPKRLRKFLQSILKADGYIVAKNYKDGYAKRTIQDRIAKIRKSIGADEYQIHGWRYNASVELAEAGNSDSHIQSVTGHKSTEMVKKYRKMADQKAQSKNAQKKRDKMIAKQNKKNKSRTKCETEKQIAKLQENQNESEDR